MPDSQLQPHTSYTDAELVKLVGPDSSQIGYQYDAQQRAFYAREASLIFNGKHGSSHISTDPIPLATCTTPGLMAADDKCRLDTLVGTRLGVLGFQGAGFPDDGGFMQGDIILAAGSETISLERVGNVIRIVVDVPAIFSCGNEDCLQIYWVQDETDVAAIRPPITGGKLSGVNSYGELKVYLFPDSQVVNPASPSTVLNRKHNYPSLIFKRYDDGVGTNEGELDVVLKRNSSGTTIVGWGFTPGATGKPECQFFLGTDENNSRLSFKLDANTTPGMLGAILYNGHVISKRSAIITGYTSTVVATNIYKAKWWDVHAKRVIGTEFDITNEFQYNLSDNTAILDSTQDALLAVGQLVDVYSFKIGESNGSPVYAHYCIAQPVVNAAGLWTTIGAIQFGDSLTTEGLSTDVQDDLKTIEQDQWGITGLEPLVILTTGNAGATVNTTYEATLDTSVPCLTVQNNPGIGDEHLRPVTIWHRASLRDALLEIHFARPEAVTTPDTGPFPPIDLLIRAPIDSHDTIYGSVVSSSTISSGTYSGSKFIQIGGVPFKSLANNGAFRVIYNNGSAFTYGTTIEYTAKLLGTSGAVYVVVDSSVTAPSNGAHVEFVHDEYTTPAARLQFTFDGDHDITLQPMVGTLDTSVVYDGDGTQNDAAFGFADGYTVGIEHWQDGATTSGTSGITSSPENFVVYTGTGVTGGDEVFNVLKVLIIDNQVWMWWNDLLMAPSQALSAVLAFPVDISTPYFPIQDEVQYGKFGLRLWPGAKLRRFIVRSRPTRFSTTTLGQLEIE